MTKPFWKLGTLLMGLAGIRAAQYIYRNPEGR